MSTLLVCSSWADRNVYPPETKSPRGLVAGRGRNRARKSANNQKYIYRGGVKSDDCEVSACRRYRFGSVEVWPPLADFRFPRPRRHWAAENRATIAVNATKSTSSEPNAAG